MNKFENFDLIAKACDAVGARLQGYSVDFYANEGMWIHLTALYNGCKIHIQVPYSEDDPIDAVAKALAPEIEKLANQQPQLKAYPS